MRRPAAPPSPLAARLKQLRPWLLPALALALLLTLWEEGYDQDELTAALEDGQPARALEVLTLADTRHLIEALAQVHWWPAESRAQRLAMLRQDVAAAGPRPREALALVSPLGAHRSPPTSARLEAPAPRDLVLQVHSRELGLEAGSRPVAAGAQLVDLDLRLLPGTTTDLVLADPGQDLMLAHAQFRLLSPAQAESVGLVMQTAYELSPTPAGGELLASLVALHYGLHEEAEQRLAALAEEPGYTALVRELRAIALARLDLDHLALALLEG